MNLFINDICIGLHSKCNWSCKYCVARWTDAEIDEDRIITQLLQIKDKLETLWISGGEPGLLSVQFWDYLFYEIKTPLSICTNGTFILRGYYDRYKSKIRRIMLHCVEEIDQDIHPKLLDFIRNSNVEKLVNFVVHKENVHLIKSFLDKYPDIKFDINFADQTFYEINKKYKKDYEFALDRESVLKVITQLSKFRSYGRYTTFLTKMLIRNDFSCLNPWSRKNLDKK